MPVYFTKVIQYFFLFIEIERIKCPFSCGVIVIYRLLKYNSVPKVYDLRREERNLNVRKMDKYVDC